MVNFSWIKENRPGNKGQSLAEVAVFGSLLLMVLAYMVSQGVSFNYEQETKMEAFRRAMQKASASNVPKAQVVDVRKDVETPDPTDMFGLGGRSTVQARTGAQGVYWSNNSTPLDYATLDTSESVQYVFNPDSNLVAPVIREYTTAALEPEPGSIIVNTDSILKGVNDIYNIGSLAQTKVYQQEPGYGTKQVMVLMNDTDCLEDYCEKSILDSTKYDSARSGLEYYGVYDVSGNAGDPPAVIDFLNPNAGQMNSTLEVQQVVNKDIKRDSTLGLVENANSYTSTESLNSAEILNHVIITSSGRDDVTVTFGDAEPTKTWTTPK
ncbi:MAG: hypothetical protein NTY14_02310 [Candidatus Omnitrophica bacterium]|nr:hypothetical protein [Candidatus Omnitrophota bacterium]